MKHTAPFAFCIAMMIGWGVAPNAFGQTVAPADDVPDELSANDWSSIRAAYDAGRHAVHADEDGYRAHNPGQQWTTRFDGRSFLTEPDAGGWTWGLELLRYGFTDSEQEVSTPLHVSTDGQNIAYDWDENLREWYVNDSRGLEHGYTVHQRPTNGEGPLTISLAVRGELHPEVTGDGRGVRFVTADGAAALTYSGLTVFDADGKELPARLSNHSEGLLLTVEERGANYPLTIDPVAQQAYLKASNTDTGDDFGTSVALSGHTVVVGARAEDSNATGANGDQSDNSLNSAGAAYVFVRNGTTWTQQAYLKASNPDAFDFFGSSVAVSGDMVVVGARGEASAAIGVDGNQADNNAPYAGAAYVFVRSGTAWSQVAYLKASNTDPFDTFGTSVAVSGNTVVVGAPYEASNANGVNGNQSDNSLYDAGAAYVFEFVSCPTPICGPHWTQTGYLKGATLTSDVYFGYSVAVSNDTVVVGASGEVPGGWVYVFVRGASTPWVQQAAIIENNTDYGDHFGISVAVSGDTIAIGANHESSSATGVNGDESDNSLNQSGAAYIFVRTGANWSRQAYLKASNPDVDDNFGTSVAVSGDTAVVGADWEASSATGVDGDQSDNSKFDSGAAYVFMRSGTDWDQRAYLKASNTDAGDAFGNDFAVAVSGDTVVVGAPGEASSATGVNGDQSDNSALGAGAAYVFTLGEPSFAMYGSGCAGTGGIVPALTMNGSATPGGQVQIDITNGLGGGQAFLFISLQQAAVDMGSGCTLNVAPMLAACVGPLPLQPGPAGAGSISMSPTIPASMVTPQKFTLQAFVADPGGAAGYSNTNGVEINIQ